MTVQQALCEKSPTNNLVGLFFETIGGMKVPISQ